MVTNTQLIALLRGRGRAADPRRGRRDDRRRADPQPRHDRRQRLRQRSDEPLPAAARRARRHLHDPQRERRAHRLRRGVLPRRLPDGGRRGRAADEDLASRAQARRRATPSPASRSARTAPTSSNAAATVGDGGVRVAHRLRLVGARAGDRDGGAPRGGRLTRRRSAPPRRASARRSTRRPTSMPRPTTAGTSPRFRPSGPSCKPPSEQRGERVRDFHEPDDLGRDQRRPATSARFRRRACSCTSSVTIST